jgi:glucokinase
VSARGGVDLGGTKIQTVVVDEANKVLGEARGQTPRTGGPADIAAAIVATMREAAVAAGVEPAELSGIGVGSPGLADEETGVVRDARNLPGWEGEFALGQALSEALGPPVKVGNDVQVATDAEFSLGAAKEFDSLLGVFWGTGVGGGLILDGKPWLGRGSAGEIGHMVVKQDGAKCPCGRRGCLEAYAGRKAMEEKAREEHENGTKTDLFKLMKKHNHDRLTSGIWERALEHDDKLAKRLFERAIEALGAGVGSAVNLLDPEAVIIGGGMGVRFGEAGVERIRAATMPHLFNDEEPPAIRVASLGDLGGAIGASLLVAEPPAS